METESQYQVAFTFQRGAKLHHVNKPVPRKCKNMAEAQEWALGVCLAKGYRLEAIRKEPTRPEQAASHGHLQTLIKKTIGRLIEYRL
jgi:hypothetical protein